MLLLRYDLYQASALCKGLGSANLSQKSRGPFSLLADPDRLCELPAHHFYLPPVQTLSGPSLLCLQSAPAAPAAAATHLFSLQLLKQCSPSSLPAPLGPAAAGCPLLLLSVLLSRAGAHLAPTSHCRYSSSRSPTTSASSAELERRRQVRESQRYHHRSLQPTAQPEVAPSASMPFHQGRIFLCRWVSAQVCCPWPGPELQSSFLDDRHHADPCAAGSSAGLLLCCWL